MLIDHADERLDFRRTYTAAWAVLFALDGHARAFAVASPDIHVEVTRAAVESHVPVANKAEQLGCRVLELRGCQRRQIRKRLRGQLAPSGD